MRILKLPFAPFVLIVVQFAILYSYWQVWNIAPLFVPDTVGYVLFADQNYLEALSSIRTIGYPIFLATLKALTGGYDSLATVQFIFYALSVLTFWFVLVRSGAERWLAFALSIPLIYNPIVQLHGHILTSDTLGLAFALFVVSAIIAACHFSKNNLIWILVAISLFASYQIRPSNLYLIVFVILFGLILWVMKRFFQKSQEAWKPAFKPFFLRLLIVSLLPFLLFSALRGVTVGHFGLVSYGGLNVIGIIAPMIDKSLISE